MCLTVILPALCRGADNQCAIAFSDLQLALILCDIVVVCLKVLALCVGDGVGYFAFSYCCYTSCSLDVCDLTIYEPVAAYCYVWLCERCSVIWLLTALGCQGYCSLVDRQSSYVCSYIAVAACVADDIVISVVLTVACVIVLNPFCCCSDRYGVASAQCEYLACAVSLNFFAVICYGVDFICMCLTVILPALCRGADNQCAIAFSDLQLALILCDIVVVCLELSTLCIGDGVGYFAFSYCCYASCSLDVCDLAIYESVTTYCYGRLCERCSVVWL